MKKLLSLFLCVFLLTAMLTACGEEEKKPNKRDDDDDDIESRPTVEDNTSAVAIYAYGLEVILNTPDANFPEDALEDTSFTLPDRIYGLNRLSLLPAGLQLQNGVINVNSPLYFAEYGADGRVEYLNANVLRGAYRADENQFAYQSGNSAKGVGVFGTGDSSIASDLSEVVSFTDTYGCVIDLLLRSDTDCKVALPSAGSGHNSRITFILSETCTKTEVDTWAQGFRIVLYDQTGKFLGTAVLNTEQGLLDDDEYSIPLVLSESSVHGDITHEGELFDLAAGETASISVLMYLDGKNLSNTDIHHDIQFSLDLYFHHRDPFY